MDPPDEISVAITHRLVDVIRLFHVGHPICTNRNVLLLNLEEMLPVDRVADMEVGIENENDLRVLVQLFEQNLVLLELDRFQQRHHSDHEISIRGVGPSVASIFEFRFHWELENLIE
tara:strand:- start:1330 stop:1680 length:351 start_codon:yes stop_codon:yes gene_type:complete